MKTNTVIALLLALLVQLTSCQPRMMEIDTRQPQLSHSTDSLLELGEMITQSTFDSLRTHLLAAMAEGGSQGAVEYCNLNASGLNSTQEDFYHAIIRRAADKARNPENQATEWELSIIRNYSDSIRADRPPYARLFKEGDKYHFVKPIFTLPLCLQCHGRPGETMTSEQEQFIKSLYPNDKATGYGDKELRGIWHVVF